MKTFWGVFLKFNWKYSVAINLKSRYILEVKNNTTMKGL